jgi:uncharacterized protein YegP (UPF0339 family)
LLDTAVLLKPLRGEAGSRFTPTEQRMNMKFEVVTKQYAVPVHYIARIKGDNGEIMFSSQKYTAKSSAKHACEVVKSNASGATITEVTE